MSTNLTKLQQLWRDYSSQEMFGEALRAEDPETFDELDAAIAQAVARDELVQEVIKLYWEVEKAAEADDPDATFDASRAYEQAIRKLAEWSPT